MRSVDDTLREAFASPDEEWGRRAPQAHLAVVARHRRDRAVRRGLAAAVGAAAVVAGVAMTSGSREPRTVDPAVPSPSVSASPVGATPLEGTWVSGALDADDVRAAARAAGAEQAASTMLGDLPDEPFRVVLVVRGPSLQARIRVEGRDDQVADEQLLTVDERVLRLRPLHTTGRTSYTWTLDGDALTMAFRSTTEDADRGVPPEAWQRLLYDTSAFTR